MMAGKSKRASKAKAPRRKATKAPNDGALMLAAGAACDRLLEAAYATRGLELAIRGAAKLEHFESSPLTELSELLEHKIADMRADLVSAIIDAGGDVS